MQGRLRRGGGCSFGCKKVDMMESTSDLLGNRNQHTEKKSFLPVNLVTLASSKVCTSQTTLHCSKDLASEVRVVERKPTSPAPTRTDSYLCIIAKSFSILGETMGVGDAFLSAFFQVALDRLASPNLLKFAQLWKVDLEMKKLSRILRKIKAVLDDAEYKQSKDKAVKEWLDELNDVAYDAEDLIDDFATEATRCKLEAARQAVAESQHYSYKLRDAIDWAFIATSQMNKRRGSASRGDV
ncbi:hypothetical protein F0562_018761 [Nyssa sinensis]|uniref:Disease resistance N-terminal domain-containing protein n=1 Tax=Nyssa sinensis TaxID=561372 RepID=A0A5J4ZDL8_9ASTE|nr:hypothetical protein F0562_018761 [Nyssa sinensis]